MSLRTHCDAAGCNATAADARREGWWTLSCSAVGDEFDACSLPCVVALCEQAEIAERLYEVAAEEGETDGD